MLLKRVLAVSLTNTMLTQFFKPQPATRAVVSRLALFESQLEDLAKRRRHLHGQACEGGLLHRLLHPVCDLSPWVQVLLPQKTPVVIRCNRARGCPVVRFMDSSRSVNVAIVIAVLRCNRSRCRPVVVERRPRSLQGSTAMIPIMATGCRRSHSRLQG